MRRIIVEICPVVKHRLFPNRNIVFCFPGVSSLIPYHSRLPVKNHSWLAWRLQVMCCRRFDVSVAIHSIFLRRLSRRLFTVPRTSGEKSMPINALYTEEIFNRFFGRGGRSFIVSPKDPPVQPPISEMAAPKPVRGCPAATSLSSDSEVTCPTDDNRRR